MSRKLKPQEPKRGAPAYIVTFSDMITLLLTFFVLLLSIADNQKEGMFARGQNSFRRAIADFGISGIMFSKDTGHEYEHPKIKYKVDKGEDEPEERSIDTPSESYRRMLEDIEKTMKISPSQITCREKQFIATMVQFDRGGWSLSKEAKAEIARHISQIGESYTGYDPDFYVVGLAPDAKTPKDQWILSGQRAQAVADYMRELPGVAGNWSIYSWGAGPGGEWTSSRGLLTKETRIMLAILTE